MNGYELAFFMVTFVLGCEAKPTTLKRPSPGDGFENHMCHTKTHSNMECKFHLNKLPTYFKS